MRGNLIKLLLYYEVVPYSMRFVKEGPLGMEMGKGKLERILREVFNDLVSNHIYCEVGV